MNIRKLSNIERAESRKVMSVAFESPFDTETAKEDVRRESEEGKFSNSVCWGAFSEDGTLHTTFNIYEYRVRFDSHQVLMGGVGGVATLPAYRRKGGVRACMKEAFKDLYERGYAFSCLYPFSTAYYRKFGYENAEYIHTWTVPVKDIKVPEAGGSITQLFPGDDLSVLTRIYNEAYKDVNMSVVREIFHSALENGKWPAEKRYIYVWKDENGEPRSFFISNKQEGTLNCTTAFSMQNAFIFTDARSFCGLLGFVAGAFPSNYEKMSFNIPGYIDPISLFPEITGVKCDRKVTSMVRAVNAEKVLSLCKCKGEGRIKIEISDPLLEENRGVWSLSFKDGENRVEKTDEVPDISLDIGDFSALICGVRSADELSWMPNVKVHNEKAPLSCLFYKKDYYLMDLF